jgi:hypothetical protein
MDTMVADLYMGHASSLPSVFTRSWAWTVCTSVDDVEDAILVGLADSGMRNIREHGGVDLDDLKEELGF